MPTFSADALLVTQGGAHANVHLDYFSRKAQRFFHIDLADGFMHGDLIANTLMVSRKGKPRMFRFSVTRDDVLKEQLKYFFSHLDKGRAMNDLKEAVPLLDKILEFRHG